MRLVLSLALTSFASAAFAFGTPEHSAVETHSKDQAGQKEFTIKVIAKEGMVVNFDAPWKLEVIGHDGLNLAKTTLNKADMDEKLPGFVVSGKADKPAGSLEYSLTAFVCTKDHTQCFREVHKGKEPWAPAKS